MKIFIVTGEPSGDLLASKLLPNLNKAFNNPKIKALAGDKLKENGIKSIFNIKDICVNGFFEVIPFIPKLINRINLTIDEIIEFNPDLIITIDAPDFNFRVIKKLRKKMPKFKGKIIHYVAPTVWAYRPKRAELVASLYDLLLVILPFEKPYFEKHGLQTKFIGHPIFTNYKILPLQKNSKNIIITPGSRKSEINRFKTEIKKLIYLITTNFGNKFQLNFFITKDSKDYVYQEYIELIENKTIKLIYNEKKKEEIIKNCHLAILKSGTNTMEMAAKSIPMIIFYKFNIGTYLIGKYFFRISNKFANLLNIQANNQIIPEYLHEKCKAELIYQEFRNFFYMQEKKTEQIQKYSKVITSFQNHENIPPEDMAIKSIKQLLVK